jgi:hypothetical protein
MARTLPPPLPVTCPAAMSDDTRRNRTAVSAGLLALGFCAFLVSLSLPGVTKQHDGRTLHVDGWTCAICYAPTGANNIFLAAAFVPWGLAVWFRSAWAYHLARIFAAVTVALFALIGAWPGYEGITRLHAGYFVWIAASMTVLAAFLVLPAPVRLLPDERLTRAETDRGRARFAAIFGVGATVTLLVTHLLVPTVVGTVREPGDSENDLSGTYETGPFRSSSGPQSEKVPQADGTLVERKWSTTNVLGPVVVAQYAWPGRALHEFAMLAMPLLFAAAAVTRRRAWRLGGAAVAAAAGLTALTYVGAPWSLSWYGMHPLELAWWGTPTAFVVAFGLLPPSRAP